MMDFTVLSPIFLCLQSVVEQSKWMCWLYLARVPSPSAIRNLSSAALSHLALSLVLTGVGAVAIACGGGWWWVWVHRGRVLVLGTTRLDGPQVAVAARPEARRRRQIQSLHCLRFAVTVRYWVPTALPTYLKERVQTHTLRAEGRLRNTHSPGLYPVEVDVHTDL